MLQMLPNPLWLCTIAVRTCCSSIRNRLRTWTTAGPYGPALPEEVTWTLLARDNTFLPNLQKNHNCTTRHLMMPTRL